MNKGLELKINDWTNYYGGEKCSCKNCDENSEIKVVYKLFLNKIELRTSTFYLCKTHWKNNNISLRR